MFVPTAKAPPKAGAKELSYNSLNLAYSGQHPCFGPNKFIQFCRQRGDEYGMPRKACTERGKDTGHQILPGLTQGSFEKKELDRTTIKLLLKWMLIERWRRHAEFNAPTCDKIAVWQLCREKKPLWNSHDSWWPELKMFGSMPWCSVFVPMAEAPTKAGAKDLSYDSLNLIHKFTIVYIVTSVFQTSLRPAQGSFSVGRTSYNN